MTGEMYWIDEETGQDSNGDVYELHAAIAKAIGGQLKPFDKYQGPYIVIGKDIRAGSGPYAIPVQNLGVIRLWIIPQPNDEESGFFCIYREDTNETSHPFWWNDESMAIEAARQLITK